MNFLLVIFLVTFFHNGFSFQFSPIKDSSICGRAKCIPGDKFEYKPGVRLEYEYSIDVSNLFVGTSKNESTLHVRSRFYLDFLTKCEGVLTFTDVILYEKYKTTENVEENLKESKVSSDFEQAIKQFPLRFSYNDGAIQEICPNEHELNWVLNYKRGVLSLFHNTMRRFDLSHKTIESDVHGTCQTKYRLLGAEKTSLIIEKVKNMASCKDRYKHHSILQTTPYHWQENRPSVPILNSSVVCNLSIDHKIYNNIHCEEIHVFYPFSNNNGGATTKVKQSLELVDEIIDEYGTLDIQYHHEIERRAPLLYNHDASPKPTSGELKVSRELLKKMCYFNDDNINVDFSDIFAKFIHTARLLSHTALFQLYSRTDIICSTARKHLLDALPYLGSSGSVHLMTDIIKDREIHIDLIHEWLLSFALIPKPTEEMLSPLSQILEFDPHDSTIGLSVSAVCHSYCRHRSNCPSNKNVKRILRILERRVSDFYESRRHDRVTKEMIIGCLKALSNIGIGSESLVNLLNTMIHDEELDIEQRVAAVDTFRRFPCNLYQNYFLALLRNTDLDPEIRIASYLKIMQCPNYFVVQTLKYLLEIEEVNQVGSFIWSHLHNILKSANPNRVEVQGLLSDKDLNNKFRSDIRKFSHNFEGSLFFEEFNAGGHYETNVILSPTSFIPKTTMFNFTLSLFGESINLFEVNWRTEGFEHYLEQLFGPQGMLNPTKFLKKNLEPFMKRFTRSVAKNSSTELQELQANVDRFKNVIDGHKFRDKKVSFGLKIFGNEVKYITMNGDEEISEALSKLNPLNYVRKIFSGKQIIFDKAAMFLDTNYIVPTGGGLPLTLNAVGTAAVKLKLYGSLRGVDFMKTKELDLLGSIHPSVTLDVLGSMSVDAYYTNTAIKLKTNIYSSQAIEGDIKIQFPHLVSFKFSLPNDKTEIIFARSELVVMNGPNEEYQKGIVENRVEQSICSWPAVDKTIGLKLCVDYYFPNVVKMKDSPYFILAGPSKFHISLKKDDLTAKIYLLEYRLQKNKNNSIISLVFDTPGSVVKRLLTTNITLDVQSQNLTLFLETSGGTTLAKGKYKDTENEKYIILELDINGKKHFNAQLSLKKEESKNGYTYDPYFYLGVNGERVAELSGQFKSMFKKDVLIWNFDVNFQTKRLQTVLTGYFQRGDAAVVTNITMRYSFLNEKTQYIQLGFKTIDKSSSHVQHRYSEFNVTCSAYHQYNLESSLDFLSAAGRLESTLQLNHGIHIKREDNKLVAQFSFLTTNKNDGRKLTTWIEVKKALIQLDWKLEFRFDQSGPSTNVKTIVRYARDKVISVALFVSMPSISHLHLETKLNVTIPSFTPMILQGKIEELVTNEYDLELKAVWFSGHNVYIRGKYQDRSSRIATNHFLKLLIQSPSFQEINLNAQYYRENTALKIDIKIYHNNEEICLLIKHSSVSPYEISSYIEGKYKTKVYSVTSSVNLKEYRQVVLEFHIDQWRDIHLGVRSLNKDHAKELGLEVKWDANRDPDQKLMVSLEFLKPEPYRYKSKFEFSYPGRSINGIFDFGIQNYAYMTFGRLTWGAGEYIELNFLTKYKFENEKYIIIKTELLTSFENWKKTAFLGGFKTLDNTFNTNASVYWLNNQHISFNLYGDYDSTLTDFSCLLKCAVKSTIQEIPSVSTSLQHHQGDSKMLTNIYLIYHPDKVIEMNSTWKSQQEETFKNITGVITLNSPFEGYRNGLLESKILLFKNKHILGLVNLDLDQKEYTLTVQGHLTKITNNTLIFNISTPVDKYRELTGRFGFSEEKRHLVAEVQTSTNVVGVEVLFAVNNMSDFNVKFHLATPLDMLQNALVLAKLKKKEAEFRLGWNNLQVGFAGIWFYKNITNFQYSYKVFTPIEGYEENGVVTKLIVHKGFDMEFTIQLAYSKVGIAVAGKRKMQHENKNNFLLEHMAIFQEEVLEDNLEDIANKNFSWSGNIELDTILYPTFKGTLDLEKKGTIYDIISIITLPDGQATVNDRCNVIHVSEEDKGYRLFFENQLTVITPYKCTKEIYMNTTFNITQPEPDFHNINYNVSLDLTYLNKTEWIAMGMSSHYVQNIEDGPHELETYNGSLHLYSPFKILPKLDTEVGLEMEENIFRVNFTFDMEKTKIFIVGNGEIDEGIIDTNINYNVISPFLSLPKTKLKLKKDYSEVEKMLDALIEMTPHNQDDIPVDKQIVYMIKLNLYIKSMQFFTAALRTKLPIRPLQDAELQTAVNLVDRIKSARILIATYPNMLNVTGSLNINAINLDIQSILAGKSYIISFDGNMAQSKEQRSLVGRLTYGNYSFDVNGHFNIFNGYPVLMNLELAPLPQGHKISVSYLVQQQPNGFGISASVLQNYDILCMAEVHVSTMDKKDWRVSIKVDTALEEYKTGQIDFRINVPGKSNISFAINASTPFKGFEKTSLTYSLISSNASGEMTYFHDLPFSKTDVQISWSWLLMENMAVTASAKRDADGKTKEILLNVFYVNKNKLFQNVKVGADININKIWTIGTNLTLYLNSFHNFEVEAHLKLPPPKFNVYSFICNTNTITRYDKRFLSYRAKYFTLHSHRYYSVSGNVNYTARDINDKRNNIGGSLQINWDPSHLYSVNNILYLNTDKDFYDVSYNLATPKFVGQDTFKTRVIYKYDTPFHNITAMLFLPENRQIADIQLDYNGLTNMDGYVNITTNFKELGHVGAKFFAETKKLHNTRILKPFWGNHSAVVNSTYDRTIHAPNITSSKGIIFLEIPLQTHHICRVDYDLRERPSQNEGHAVVIYNDKQVLDGKYKCDSENSHNFDKDIVNIEVENSHTPFGLNLVKQFEYKGIINGKKIPKLDWKSIEIYRLHNRTNFNISGEYRVESRATGQKLYLSASHINRTVTFDASYDILPKSFLQMSRLQLAHNHWLAYDLNITKEMLDSSEAQNVEINVMYPKRNFTFLAAYNVTASSLVSDAYILWDKKSQERSVQASFYWERYPDFPIHHELEFQLKHPSFEKNVSLKGDFKSNQTRLGDLQIIFEYADDPRKTLYLQSVFDNIYNDTVRYISYNLTGSHPETNLHLRFDGEFDYDRMSYQYCHWHNYCNYRRTFLPMEYGTIDSRIDLDKNEVEYKKNTRTINSYFKTKYSGTYPVYTANMTRVFGEDINEKGEFYMHIKDKLIRYDMNLTKDASQSFHIYGEVPDTRSAVFNVWSNYEDITLSDIAYFIRLNHSRLITSRFQWRPELETDLKSTIRSTIEDYAGNFSETLDYWKQSIRSEMHDAIKDISDNAQPHVQQFIDDLKALKVLKEDADNFIIYLNQSYNTNAFYIRDVVGFGMGIVDEMAIRKHIESLPAIINEIWDVMGESGKVIQKSIMWIIETVENSYKKIQMLLNELMKEDAMERMITMMERILENYDKLMKDLHVEFMKYMEKLWDKIYVSLTNQWYRFLHSIEPTFIEFAHYIESLVYNMAKEFLDFIYIRTSEIVESPYFNQFTNFTADVDKFYRDVTEGDTITVIYKYSNIVFNFLKKKYFSIVPFGKELQDVAFEIVNELNELKKLPSIHYLTVKWSELQQKLLWIYEYLDIGKRTHFALNLLRSKLTGITETALQAENRYREAKTKFVYDPNTGIIYFEQKLPVSWHAFNDTPEFREIPEYQAIYKLQNYFESSNFTIRTLYHYYKSYIDFEDWLPPFNVRAIIAGSQHYMTFDKSFYEFRGSCSYLLAHDFVDRNFTVAISYDAINEGETYVLHIILASKELVNIDVFNNMVTLGNNSVVRLPATIGNTYIYQHADVLTFDSLAGFTLQCNLRFNVCTMDAAGWYFGKTAGLWGTINNEHSDDLLTSKKLVTPHLSHFTQSWALEKNCHSVKNQAIIVQKPNETIYQLCESLFVSKVSPLQAGFQRVTTKPFMKMCLNSETELDICTVAVAYIEACAGENTPIRMPDTCIKCETPNEVIGEGEAIAFNGSSLQMSTDVVFIIEAKDCNKNIKHNRNTDILVSLLQKEFEETNLHHNRYSVVTFGGDGVFDDPRSIAMNNKIFANDQDILPYFDNIPTGDGNSDIFEAISFATRLIFRPGVSRTFILLPCSDCDASKMIKMDYAALHQLLEEYGITLHILMDKEFTFEKTRINKLFFGMDNEYGYTKKDGRILKGDKELRQQVRIPKSDLGLCVPLALETNGTIFTAKKLEGAKNPSVKKFVAVLAKRIAKTAYPTCQTCECTAHDNGVSYMECFPCHYQTNAFMFNIFSEDDLINAMQPMSDDYSASYEDI